MSTNQMIAYVAIRRYRGGAMFAYLPNTNIQLPEGWAWNWITDDDGRKVIDTFDCSGVATSMRYKTLDETCRLMCEGTGITWEEK